MKNTPLFLLPALFLLILFAACGGCTADSTTEETADNKQEHMIEESQTKWGRPSNSTSRRFNIPVKDDPPRQQPKAAEPTFEHRVVIKTDGVITRGSEKQWWIKSED